MCTSRLSSIISSARYSVFVCPELLYITGKHPLLFLTPARMAMQNKSRNMRLPPEVNRILFVRNLPFKITSQEMYDLFGKYGSVRQVRVGNQQTTKGTAYVVYDDIFDAKNACEHLSGYHFMGRYLIVLFHSMAKLAQAKADEARRKE